MARSLTAAAKNSAQASVVRPVVLVKMQFDSGAMRVWSGRGDITFNSEVYGGVGDFGKIGAVEEGVEQRAFGIALTLSGIPASTISLALGEDLGVERDVAAPANNAALTLTDPTATMMLADDDQTAWDGDPNGIVQGLSFSGVEAF